MSIDGAEITFCFDELDADCAEELLAVEAFMRVEYYLVAYGTDEILFDFSLSVFFVHELPNVALAFYCVQFADPFDIIVFFYNLFHF